jgi:2-oxo-4-hydroxy-4-carboxy-5-ureidoimidazoline decarboxylase
MSDIAEINTWNEAEARTALLRCCGSTRWAARMCTLRPFADRSALFTAAEAVWRGLSREDWLEAFAAHPRIGDLDSLRHKFAATAEWASGEQAGARGASEEVLHALAEGNRAYETRFGHIFIVCATGKSAAEMLALLRERLNNTPEEELRVAAAEQEKITRIRLEKLCP